jgi:NTE family protein
VADEVRALVLGGGGVTGVAWEIGLLAGLAAAGVPVRDADVVVGTSAGSVVAAQLGSDLTLDELYQRQLRPARTELTARMGPSTLLRYALSTIGGDDRAARARLGRLALRAPTMPEAERRAVIADRLPTHEWPVRPRLLITGVVAETGEAVVWHRDSGVGLVDAVAASCSVPLVWPAVTIDGVRYVDGGLRSPVNADLAAGCDRVLILAPTRATLRRSGRVERQVAALGPGVRSVVVSPDRPARTAIGRNVLDPAFRAAAARAGHTQAASVADAVAAAWT